MLKLNFVLLVLAVISLPRALYSQETLALPTDAETRTAVRNASDWLMRHVKTGRLTVGERESSISVIAWKDPTLSPELASQLAGYAITDTLWASYALTLTQPQVAEQLHDSLEALDCLGNSLHEVIWKRIESIAHKPVDADIVHGRSIGIMSSENVTIDVRSFTMAADRDFENGHPSLFAEHAAYQSLYEFRLGKHESARERLRSIFRSPSDSSQQQIRWNSQQGLLVDFVTDKDVNAFLAGDTKTCRQYSFKLATLFYACRLLGLDREFPTELEKIRQRLVSAQLKSGGIAHFFDVEAQSDTVHTCPDATGEATAIYILSMAIVPNQIARK
jgi:hypothetical protein